jgi:hypothetical protein
MEHLTFRPTNGKLVCQSSVDSLSDEQLIKLIRLIDYDKDSVGTLGPRGETTVDARITADAVAKPELQSPCEGFVMRYVAERTTVRIPTLRRNLIVDTEPWIVMNYIEGETLEFVWPKASIWQKCYIVWTLRCYIRQIRRIPLPNYNIPGPFDQGG